MRLDHEQTRELLRALGRTRESELDCDGCLAELAAYLESAPPDRDRGEAFRLVREHLALCGECREELDLLRAAVGESGPNGAKAAER
jgi:hypothetical protein